MTISIALLAGAVSILVFAAAHSFKPTREFLDWFTDWRERLREDAKRERERQLADEICWPVGEVLTLPPRQGKIGWRGAKEARRSHRRLRERLQ